MVAELLFFSVLLIGILQGSTDTKKFGEYIHKPLYMAWLLMSISIFGYTPSAFQYVIRAGCMAYSVAVLVSQKSLLLRTRKVMGIIWVYILFCFISTIWSVDKLQTLIKTFEIAIDFLLVSAIIKAEDSPEKAVYRMLDVLLKVCIIIEIFVVFGCIFDHSSFITFSRGVMGIHLTGGIVSADSLGGISVFIIACILNMPQYKNRNLYLSIAIVELFLCQARTSLVSFVIVLAIYFFRTKRKWLYCIIILMLISFIVVKWDLVVAYFLRGSDVMNLQTMSGRTTMWEMAKELIKERPLLGYGFGSGGEMVSILNNGMTSLHSGIYEGIMGVGYIGFSLIAIAFIIVWSGTIWNIVRFGLKNNTIELMLLCDLTIRTYMSTGIGGWHSHVLMIWFALVAADAYVVNGTMTSYLRKIGIEKYISNDS